MRTMKLVCHGMLPYNEKIKSSLPKWMLCNCLKEVQLTGNLMSILECRVSHQLLFGSHAMCFSVEMGPNAV